MKHKLTEIWKDPVWSKVIASALIGAALLLWGKISGIDFGGLCKVLLSSYEVPLWLIVIFLLVMVNFLYRIFKSILLRKKQIEPEPLDTQVKEAYSIEGINDVRAVIDSWWPKTEGMCPDDVYVNFKELEKKFEIKPGMVGQEIDSVAVNRHFKIKIRGENHATYEYDHDRLTKN